MAGAPAGATAELERQAPGGRWAVLARAGINSGRFRLRWTPKTGGFVIVRVVVVRRHALLARTAPQSLLVGAAPVLCAPADPAKVPPGEGRIVGGVYNVGGPAPGIYVCQGEANTVTLTSASVVVVATQPVAAGQSYSFVVPPGTYKLTAGFCEGTASVSAGQTVTADTVCPVP